MRYAELIQLYFERSSALQWYWTLYVVIAGGLLAFSSLRQRPDWITGILVTVLFCMFAYKNLGAIRDTTFQRIATQQAVQQFSSVGLDAEGGKRVGPMLEPTLVTPAYEDVRNFHILSDVLVVAALWAMELRRIRKVRDDHVHRGTLTTG